MASFKAEGLVLMPEVAKEHTLKWLKKRKALLKTKWVSPYEIKEYNLLSGIKSQNTIKNWCTDPKRTELVEDRDWYRDDNGHIKILHATIKQLNT
jgi:hypothetical protein